MPGNLAAHGSSPAAPSTGGGREGLYISRVPTVVTLSQMEAEADQKKRLRCSADDLRQGTLPLLCAPLMPQGAFCSKKRVNSFGNLAQAAAQEAGGVQRVFLMTDSSGSSDTDDSSEGLDAGFTRESSPVTPLRPGGVFGGFGRPDGVPSAFEARALAAWDEAEKGGLFRYSVAADTETRLLPGPYNFVAQVNEGRATKKRPTEFRVDRVVQPFDPAKFNFQKAAQSEVLFALDFDPELRHASFDPRGLVCCEGCPSPHLVFINVSPIEYGHLLLVPSATESLPQVVLPRHLGLALHMAAAADNPFFRVGFNSLGAYGTINHLHFQAYFLPYSFPCERAPVLPLRRVGNVAVGRLEDYPVNAIVFEAANCLDELAQVAGGLCERLSQANVPHNLMIFDRGARVMVFPQCFAEKQARGEVPEDILEMGVNPACFEIAGHIVYKRQQDYVRASQDSACRLLAEVSLPEPRFAEVLALLD